MTDIDRRAMVALGLGVVGLACTRAKDASDEKEGEEDVGPIEDLMREHGILERVLLVYEEGARRLEAAANGDAMVAIAKSAEMVRTFIEEYHEQNEEKYLFPRFEKAKQHVELVTTLKLQHVKGRALTEVIRASAKAEGDDARKRVIDATRAFSRMYRPHAAREDTVLFVALHGIVSHHEMHELGERMEESEHARFGKDGFEDAVKSITAIEATLGIDRLESFTPS
ncbi:MAG: hemerythrin domain-containing protein [Polyangiales bacterium]